MSHLIFSSSCYIITFFVCLCGFRISACTSFATTSVCLWVIISLIISLEINYLLHILVFAEQDEAALLYCNVAYGGGAWRGKHFREKCAVIKSCF